jgi:hypothetical protein
MDSGSPIHFGRLLVVVGAALVMVGLAVIAGSRLGLGRLPGDIAYKGKHVSFYFPLATCILLSVLATLILWLISFLRRP